MNGGSVFDFTFKLPVASFLFAFIITIVIALFLAIIFGTLFAGNYMAGSNKYVYAVLGFAYAVLALYAPYDYIYTMGYNAAKL
jgi:hypothetical protein